MAECYAVFTDTASANKWAAVAPGRGCYSVRVSGKTVYFLLTWGVVNRINGWQ